MNLRRIPRMFLLCALLCACLFVRPENTLSQDNRLRYIFPDVCAPNMSVYVEMYAAPWDILAFGKDSLYANNPGDSVRVELARPADSTKVIIGPVVVSWNGRLISTQVFVLPKVEPNSSDWKALRSEFRIPIHVVVSGRADSVSNTDTLYIVNPYTSIAQISRNTGNANSFILGEVETPEGIASVRSRRGAIIVSDLRLAPANLTQQLIYTVSTLDCDAATPGNQGFLPFALLSRGNIVGENAIIAANAVGNRGGAGGGGGGGQVCDELPSFEGGNSRMRGGDGFTGGGSGGLNKTNRSDIEQQWSFAGGVGSGQKIPTPITPFEAQDARVLNNAGGNSLNGTRGGDARARPADSPEASGGGTGHPFGISGTTWNYAPAQNQMPAETEGAGIGRSDGKQGDGAGFGTRGFSNELNGFLGGQRHGNEPVVPIAGGSGGGGGNPRGFCAGEGGGGGGAIRISAQTITNLNVEAKGATGLAGTGFSPVRGGSGSGGHIAIHSRSATSGVFLNVMGGDSLRDRHFGAGRMRFDTPNRIAGVNPTERRPRVEDTSRETLYTSYTGITLDSLTRFVASPFTREVPITGFAGAQGDIVFFRRTLQGRWETTATASLSGSTQTGFNSPIAFSTQFSPRTQQPLVPQDSLVLIVSAQKVFNPEPIGRETIPNWVMSQSGTAILNVLPLPLIRANLGTPSGNSSGTAPELAFPPIQRCGLVSASSEAQFTVSNARAGVLRIDSVRVKNRNSFFSVSPSEPEPSFHFANGSLRLNVRFNPTAAFPVNQNFGLDTLLIYHTDTIPDVGGARRPNPLVITLRAPVRTIFFNPRPDADSEIQMGSVAIGSSRDTVITIRNSSADALRFTVSAAQPLNSAPFRFTERTLTSSDSVQIPVRFQPTQQGNAAPQTVVVRVSANAPCTEETTFRFTLRGVGTQPQLNLALTDSLVNFRTLPPACFPATAQADTTFKVESTGNDSLRGSLQMASAVASTTGTLGFTLSPSTFVIRQNDIQVINLRFRAPLTTQASITIRDTILLTTNDPRPEARLRRIPVSITVQSILVQATLSPRGTVGFGNVQYFVPQTRTVQVSNNGNSVISLTLNALPSPFRILRPVPTGTPPQASLQLVPGARDSVIVEMLPTEAHAVNVPFSSVLRFSYASNNAVCTPQPDSITFTGIPSGQTSMQARIWLDTLREVNMLRDTSVRLWGQVIGTVIDRRDNFRGALRIHRGMFFPRSLSSTFGTATLDSIWTDSLDRYMTFTVQNIRLGSTPTLMATLSGTPILTDTMRSAWEWSPLLTRWTRGDSVYAVSRANYGNGLLVMNAVLQGQNNTIPRLVNNAVRRPRVAIAQVFPSPARDEISVSAYLGQQGAYSLNLVTVLGIQVLSHTWTQSSQDTDENVLSTLRLSLGGLTRGVYGLILVAPSGERHSALITVER